MTKSQVINVLYLLLGYYISQGNIQKDTFDEMTKAVSLIIRILQDQDDWA